MPNPLTHMEMAYHAAQLVDAPLLNEYMAATCSVPLPRTSG